MASGIVFSLAFPRPDPVRRDRWAGKRIRLRGEVPYLEIQGKCVESPFQDRELRVLYAHGNQEDLCRVRI